MFLGSVVVSSATTISHAAVDLPNVVSGMELWQSQYTVTGFPLATDQGFPRYFDQTLYEEEH